MGRWAGDLRWYYRRTAWRRIDGKNTEGENHCGVGCCFAWFFDQPAIGRWGNFINQEAFGTRTTVPWRMYSENTEAVVGGLRIPAFCMNLSGVCWGSFCFIFLQGNGADMMGRPFCCILSGTALGVSLLKACGRTADSCCRYPCFPIACGDYGCSRPCAFICFP